MITPNDIESLDSFQNLDSNTDWQLGGKWKEFVVPLLETQIGIHTYEIR